MEDGVVGVGGWGAGEGGEGGESQYLALRVNIVKKRVREIY